MASEGTRDCAYLGSTSHTVVSIVLKAIRVLHPKSFRGLGQAYLRSMKINGHNIYKKLSVILRIEASLVGCSRLAPAVCSIFATNLALIGARDLSFLSCLAYGKLGLQSSARSRVIVRVLCALESRRRRRRRERSYMTAVILRALRNQRDQ